ncbi:MAG: hypothetical protein AAF413_03415 [Patescibacteria group bacterium]
MSSHKLGVIRSFPQASRHARKEELASIIGYKKTSIIDQYLCKN